jgi:hypothetical protein
VWEEELVGELMLLLHNVTYGVEGGQLKGGGREASLWWCDVHALCTEEWCIDHVSCSVGNGKHTLFWSGVWLGGVSFRVRFNRLYDLLVFKGEYVFDMCQLGWGRRERRGGGGGGCLHGRRSWWGNLCYCFIM